jgi:ribosomal small subunit protein bTHX
MGKGDKKTKKGKIHIGSYGVKRPRKAKKKAATAKKAKKASAKKAAKKSK